MLSSPELLKSQAKRFVIDLSSLNKVEFLTNLYNLVQHAQQLCFLLASTFVDTSPVVGTTNYKPTDNSAVQPFEVGK